MTETTLSYISPDVFAFNLREKVQNEWAKQRMSDCMIKIVYGIENIAILILGQKNDCGTSIQKGQDEEVSSGDYGNQDIIGETQPTADQIIQVMTQDYLDQVVRAAQEIGLKITRLLLNGESDNMLSPGKLKLTIEYIDEKKLD